MTKDRRLSKADVVIVELARVFCDRDEAALLAKRAGFPRERLPDFRMPQVFWAKVAEEIQNGALPGGLVELTRHAALMYPRNDVFRGDSANSCVHPGAPSLEHAPAPGSAAAELEAAYQRYEELIIAGDDTTDVNEVILSLRRKQRQGPVLHPGEFLGGGRFRLIEIVGRGGVATVWKSYDRKRRELVAVKVLHGQFAQDSTWRERLFRGARKMAELQHPNVVRVLVPEGEEQGFYYYVMEYLGGGNLFRAVVEDRVDTDSALAIVGLMAGALVATHAKGWIHRDVKPQNILLRENEAPALSDFDLVQAKDTTGGTRTGAMGTMLYAAPEQNEDASRVDHRADIYSLGMTAIFCIYGKKLPHRAVFQRDEFLAELEYDLGLLAVLAKAVALRPEDRLGSMSVFWSEFLAELASAQRSSAVMSASTHPVGGGQSSASSSRSVRDLDVFYSEEGRRDEKTGLLRYGIFYRRTIRTLIEVMKGMTVVQEGYRSEHRDGIVGDFSLILVDIDNFKIFNSVFGYLVADSVLHGVAAVLIDVAEEYNGIAGRYGGEEFCVLISGVGPDTAKIIARDIRDKVNREISVKKSSDGSIRVVRRGRREDDSTVLWSSEGPDYSDDLDPKKKYPKKDRARQEVDRYWREDAAIRTARETRGEGATREDHPGANEGEHLEFPSLEASKVEPLERLADGEVGEIWSMTISAGVGGGVDLRDILGFRLSEEEALRVDFVSTFRKLFARLNGRIGRAKRNGRGRVVGPTDGDTGD